MKLNEISQKIKKYNFKICNAEPENISFSKGDIKINFKKERFDGWELYFIYKNNVEIKLDFLLEIYTYGRSIKDIVKFFEGGFNSELDSLIYLFILLFKEGIFILKNDVTKIDEFINWHNKNSEYYYSEFLKQMIQ